MKLIKNLLTPPLVAISVALCAALSSFGADVQKYIEYVQTDGNEYVLLDYTPTSSSVVEIDVSMQAYATPCFFCSRGNAEDAGTFTLQHLNGKGLRWDYNRTTAQYQNVGDTSRHRFRVSGEGLWKDGQKSTTIVVQPQEFTPPNRMMLFASYICEPGETPVPDFKSNPNPTRVQLYRFRAWDDNGATLKVDLRPCIDTDGAIGLYDAVSKQIYYNLNPGKSFTASSTVVTSYDDVLTVQGYPVNRGEGLDPAYGYRLGLSEGDSLACSAPASWTDGAVTATCAGYEVVADGKVVQSGTANSFTYVHPKNENGVTLTWKWNRTAASTGVTRTWTGAGADNNASTAANWDEGVAPVIGDSIRLDGTSTKDMTWDAGMKDVLVYDWTQTADYTGTVTIETTYNTTHQVLEILHDAVLSGGIWQQKANPKCDIVSSTGIITYHRDYRLNVRVGGAMTVAEGVTLTAAGMGYSLPFLKSACFKDNNFLGGSHGGLGAWNKDYLSPAATGDETYDSVVAPEEPGGGGKSNGGGAIRLDVAGALTLDGVVNADASTGPYYTGAGGSVYIRAGEISGAGSITARALTTGAYEFGGGGRIAIILTSEGADFTAFDPVAQCSAIAAPINAQGAVFSNAKGGGPGTIYAETPADVPGKGWLIFKDNGYGHNRQLCNAWPFDGDGEAFGFSRLTLAGGAMALVPADKTLDCSAATVVGDATSGVLLTGGTFKPPAGAAQYSISVKDVPSTLDGDLFLNEGSTVTDDAGLTVTGDMMLNGTLTRSGPFTADAQPLDLTVGGDLTVGATGVIDASGKGYSAKAAPAGVTVAGSQDGGSFGGRGWKYAKNNGPSVVETYGSITDPAQAGTGGSNVAGGGLVRLDVSGDLVLNGSVLANGLSHNHYPGSGGAINIRAATLSGSGSISADAGRDIANVEAGPAGGGRVAIRLTKAGADFSSFANPISARGSRISDTVGKWVGGAGTVWTSTAAQGETGGTLRVDNFFAGLVQPGETTVGGALMTGDSVFGDVIIGDSAVLALADNQKMTVAGSFSNAAAFRAGAGSVVVFAGAGESRVTGNATFANLSADAPGKAIVVDDGAVIEVTGDGALTGAVDNNLTLRSATEGEQWTLKGANIALTGVALRDCQSESPITVMNGTDLGGNSENITFVNVEPGQLITWTGAADAAWGNAANWDRARTPIATDKVAVPAGAANQPVLATDAVVAEITVAAGASLSLGGKALTVTGNATFEGAVIAADADVLDVKGDLSLAALTPASSTVRLSGEEQTLTLNATTFFALDLQGATTTVAGDVSATTLTVGNGADAFDVAFAEGVSVSLNSMTVAGDRGTTNGVLRCATAGGTWNLAVNDAHVSGVSVSGSDASRGVTVVPTDCADGGDNVNWLFVDNRTHWTGALNTDFANASNWSDGVPTATKDAVIEGDVECIIASAAAAGNFTVNPGAKVTVNADFAVNGACTILSGATVAWNVPGTITGNLVLLSGATLTHDGNTTAEVNKLDLTVGGTGYIAAGAVVDATGKGYCGENAGPGATGGAEWQCGASHGGHGYHLFEGVLSKPCYGSALQPTTLGSSGFFSSSANAGGGAVKLVFVGALQLDGSIVANAKAGASNYTGAGGSVWLTAPSIAGKGSIAAQGGDGTAAGFGGGGRVAVYLTDSTAHACAISVRGGIITTSGKYGTMEGSVGTYYLETAKDRPGAGTLLIAAPTAVFESRRVLNDKTDLGPEELEKATVVVKNGGSLSLAADTKIASLVVDPADTTALLKLNGYTLSVHTRKPKDFDDTRVTPGERTDPETGETVVGCLEWLKYGLSIIVR